jgi:hypothetical protein
MLNSKNAATALTIMKWPVALLFLGFLPASTLLLWHELSQLIQQPLLFKYVSLGFCAYMFVWYLFIRNTSISILSTFEHEITHCIFAWLTFNRVTGLSATLRSGGHMKYEGHPNWLLSIAPYFFPTLTFSTLLILSVAWSSESYVGFALVGVTLAYHITSTIQETHHAQTDLQEVGFLFSILFLPTANLFCYSVVLAVLIEGRSGVINCFTHLTQSQYGPMWLISLIKTI